MAGRQTENESERKMILFILIVLLLVIETQSQKNKQGMVACTSGLSCIGGACRRMTVQHPAQEKI
jgi:hypothetical protein